MIYNIRLCVRKDGKTYIQEYSDDLIFISEWELSDEFKSIKNFATDNDGNVYLGWLGDNWLRKYTNEGIPDGTAYTYEVRDVKITVDGHISASTKFQTTQYRVYQRNSDLSARDYLNMTAARMYGTHVWEDDDIFYVNNGNEQKIEKWSWIDKEKKVTSTENLSGGAYCMGMIGDTLGGAKTGGLWSTNKSLTGPITYHTIDECEVTGEIYARDDVYLGQVGDNYIVAFKAVTEYYMDYGAWFLRRYDGSFNKIGTTVFLAICSSSISHYFSVASKRESVSVVYPIVTNIKAENVGAFARTLLYGELSEDFTVLVNERGFEYKIQDDEPGEEDTGIEVKEIKEAGFIAEGYNLRDKELYDTKENTIWWFRAYCKDSAENKYIAASWMKNVPTLTTSECTDVGVQEAKANGELIDKGANDVTERGFRIIKEYKGDQFGMDYYIGIAFGDYEVLGDIKEHTISNELGTIIGYFWTAIFYRDSIIGGNFNLGVYDKTIGGGLGGGGEGFALYLRPNDTYLIQAIAKNNLGWGFGKYINSNTLLALLHERDLIGYTEGDHKNAGIKFADIVESVEMQGEEPEIVEYENIIQFTTGRYILPGEDENVSETSAEKTVKLGVIPGETTVTRIGIRLGRTKGCNEIHVYQDGEWGSYAEVTFYIEGFEPGCTYYKMPYIIIDYGDYSEEILAMPDYTNPDKLEEYLDDYPIEIFPEVEEEPEKEIVDSSVGDISYRTIIREIKCEVVGEQSLIDYYGRRRSKTINNHMIQSKSVCIIIINNYLDKFQRIKLKVVIEIDMPIPFEREDVILLGDGKIKYREDGQGLIAFKADGEGELLQKGYILAKVRKIDISYIASTETEAILLLELEV